MKSLYTIPEIARKYDIPYITAYKRSISKYADKRWGVQSHIQIDGSVKRVVPEDKLHLWETDVNYQGRPYED